MASELIRLLLSPHCVPLSMIHRYSRLLHLWPSPNVKTYVRRKNVRCIYTFNLTFYTWVLASPAPSNVAVYIIVVNIVKISSSPIIPVCHTTSQPGATLKPCEGGTVQIVGHCTWSAGLLNAAQSGTNCKSPGTNKTRISAWHELSFFYPLFLKKKKQLIQRLGKIDF